MRLFFLTHSVIGSIDGQILILTNRQVVLMGLIAYDKIDLLQTIPCPTYRMDLTLEEAGNHAR